MHQIMKTWGERDWTSPRATQEFPGDDHGVPTPAILCVRCVLLVWTSLMATGTWVCEHEAITHVWPFSSCCASIPWLHPQWLPQSALDKIFVCSLMFSLHQDILMPSCSRICLLPFASFAGCLCELASWFFHVSQRFFNCIWLAYQSASCLLFLLSGSLFSLLLVHSVFPPPAARRRLEAFLGIQALTSQTVSGD